MKEKKKFCNLDHVMIHIRGRGEGGGTIVLFVTGAHYREPPYVLYP